MPEPITREEVYLNAIATNTGGGDGGSVPEPITRIEQYLDQIATNTAGGGGGGGGGSSLPAVTSEDNGDVLTVVEGAWAKAAPSGGALAVSVNDQTGGLDKTWQEIFDAACPVFVTKSDNEHSYKLIEYVGNEGSEYYVEVSGTDYVTNSADGYPMPNV